MRHHFFYGVFAVFLFIFIWGTESRAETHKVKHFTQDNIRSFIHDITDKANKVKKGRDVEAITSFFNAHLHHQAFFTSGITYDIPGYPNQKNSLSMDREKYIVSLTQSQDIVSAYEAKVEIKNIRISKDKKKATLKTLSTEVGTVMVPDGGVNNSIPIDGTSECDQVLMLSDENIIQIYSANCQTRMSFQEF